MPVPRPAATVLVLAALHAPLHAQAPQSELPDRPWWEELGDPLLPALIGEAFAANGDVRAAAQAIIRSEASASRARAALLPGLSVDAQSTTGPFDGVGFQFGGIPREDGAIDPPSRFYTGSASLRATYRLTSFGSELRTSRAAGLEGRAARGDEDGVALALAGEVAAAYYDAVSAARQRAVIERQLEVGEQLTEVLRLRYERGEATALEVLQQRQQLATTRATLPTATIDLRLAESRLATLVGRDPSAEVSLRQAALPPVPAATPPSVRLTAEDRPDLRSAALRVDATAERASAARWSRLPALDFSASTGSQFFRSFTTNTQSTWGMTLSASLPLFDGFDRSSRIREATAAEREARASFEQTRRTADAAVVEADIRREGQAAQLDALRLQLEASEQAFDESRRRYLAGLATVLDVLTAMNGMQQAELGVIRTERAVLDAWIQQRQALGGSWTRDVRRRVQEAR